MKSYADTFKVISDQNRLKILEILSDGEMCAGEIQKLLTVTQPTLSHHLKVMCKCGLVSAKRHGKNVYYSLNGASIAQLIQYLDNFSKNTKDYKDDNSDSWERLVTFID